MAEQTPEDKLEKAQEALEHCKKERTAAGEVWVERKEGDVYEGPFVDGKRQGHWALRYADGAVYEGPVVGGQPHGLWTLRDANGDVSEVTYENGEPQDQ